MSGVGMPDERARITRSQGRCPVFPLPVRDVRVPVRDVRVPVRDVRVLVRDVQAVVRQVKKCSPLGDRSWILLPSGGSPR